MSTNITLIIIAIIYYLVNIIYDLFFANKFNLKKVSNNEIDLSHFDTKPNLNIDNIQAKVVKGKGITGKEGRLTETLKLQNEEPLNGLALSKNEIIDEGVSIDIPKEITPIQLVEDGQQEERAEPAEGISYESIEVEDNFLIVNDFDKQEDFIINETNLLTYTNLIK